MDTDEKTSKALAEFNNFIELFNKDKLAAYELLKKIKLSFVKKHYKDNFPRPSKEMLMINYAENIRYFLKNFPKSKDGSLKKILTDLKDISEKGIIKLQNEKWEINKVNMRELRKVLHDNMVKLQNDAITPGVFNAVANACGKILSIIIREMEYSKFIGRAT